ncbi:MAG: 30S ribosomal protein S4 [Patescibacteria group bacterium]
MLDLQCKKCRRAGEKLFLKGERCFTPKCAMVRKPYPAGVHGKSKKKKRTSEYGLQLQEKQKLKFTYGLREKQFSNYVAKSIARKIESNRALAEFLESRLDNAVFRCGFALSRTMARQMVSHGHILVNGRKVNIPSFGVKPGDTVKLRPQSLNKGIFGNLDLFLKKYEPPAWLSIDKSKKECKILTKPSAEVFSGININAIIEFYSR